MKILSPLESAIQADTRLALGMLPHVRMFRNNRGVAWMGNVAERIGSTVILEHARPVEFGLVDGASDLIGPVQRLIVPSMVGQTVALFGALEVKRPKVPVPDHQQRFIDFVNAFGGIAGVIRSPEEALALVGKWA